jgi:transcriptional regulator with XRE-family HTH domain
MPVVDSALLFGRCIATIRKSLHLTQQQFARRLRITRSALAQVETGRSTINFFTLIRLGEELAEERVDEDPTAALSLFHLSAAALQDDGVRVVNRPPKSGDNTLSTADIDFEVMRIYRAHLAERYRRVRVVRFEYDD